jgi:hypothetical protein
MLLYVVPTSVAYRIASRLRQVDIFDINIVHCCPVHSWAYDGISSFPVVAVGRSTESSIFGSLAGRAVDDAGDRLCMCGGDRPSVSRE